MTKIPGNDPIEAEFIVESLSDGCFMCQGPYYGGSRMNLGPMALLRCKGVRVAVCSRKVQAAEREMFRHLGAEPSDSAVLVLKSSVHFRADFQPIAKEVLVAATPGPALADPSSFPWKRLRSGLRLKPMGPVFDSAA